MKIANLTLVPAVNAAPDATVVAPGTSCRHQLHDAARHQPRFIRCSCSTACASDDTSPVRDIIFFDSRPGVGEHSHGGAERMAECDRQRTAIGRDIVLIADLRRVQQPRLARREGWICRIHCGC